MARSRFQALGLSPAIAAEAEPIRGIRVADDNAPLPCFQTIASFDRCALSWIIENRSCAAP